MKAYESVYFVFFSTITFNGLQSKAMFPRLLAINL